jgi:stearoyl-CoA 9-desaturase NADPH oxidoreductase
MLEPVIRSTVARVAGLVATPLVPADFVDLIDPLRSGTQLRARIVAVRPETADAATLVLRPGRGWAGHVPGQYVRVGVDVDGVRRWRAYSVTSPPRTDGLISITVKAIPDGVVSNHLVHRARPGTVIQLDQATGDFTLPADPGPLLFVTAGSGITPVLGMLRHHVLDDVVLVHSAPTPADVIAGAELRALGNLRLVEWHSDDAGFLTSATLKQLVPDWATREVWACGPTGLLDALEAEFPGVRTERFRPAIVVTGDGGSVTFTKTGKTARGAGDTPLLDVGEDAGVLMPSGCRMGICFGCVSPLRRGAVRDLRTGELTTAAEGDDVMVQTCVSAAAGDCAVDR